MPADRPFVLYVGRLEPRKGVDRLIRAMAIVRRERAGRAAGHRRRWAGSAGARSAGARARRRRALRGPRDRRGAAWLTIARPTSCARRRSATRASASCCSRPWPPAGRSSRRASRATRSCSQGAGSARLVDVDDTAALAREIVAAARRSRGASCAWVARRGVRRPLRLERRRRASGIDLPEDCYHQERLATKQITE